MFRYNTGVTGQNIPPAEIYPGLLWPRPIYAIGHIIPGYNLTWAVLIPGIIRAGNNLSRLNSGIVWSKQEYT